MGLTLYSGIERGNIACHKSEARFGTLLREGRLASRASRDEAFWRSQVNFGPPNPATDDKALWSKGKRVRCHTPGLPKVPRGRARRSRATTRERIPHRQGDWRRPSRGTSRPTDNTGETWEDNPIGSQRIHSTCSPTDFIFIIFESGGKGSLFCNRKNGADFTRHNLTMHPIPMICA